jgi:PEP-CTERM motif
MSIAHRSAFLISLSLLLTPSLWGAAIYSYDSPTFTYFGTTGLPSSTFISASVTYNSVLAPNLSDASLSNGYTADLPSSWLFSDGVEQWTPSNSKFFIAAVNTDASGNIIGWSFVLSATPGFPATEIYTYSTLEIGSDEVVLSANPSDFAVGPGSDTPWSLSITHPTVVPEPDTLSLLGLGAFAVGLIRRCSVRKVDATALHHLG